MTYYLYRHIRLDTGKPFYIGIGSVVHLYGRDRSRYARAYSFSQRSKHWRNTVKKAGIEVEILMESEDHNFIKEKEKEFIILYGRYDMKTGFLVNKTDGAEGHLSIEARKKISERVRKRKHTPEARAKISAALRLRVISDYTRELMRQIGKKNGINPKSTLAAAEKRKIPVIQLDKKNNIIKEWPSIIEASRALSIDRGDITKSCKMIGRHAGGFKWKYNHNLNN